ncbi:MAG: ISAs1 family transposase [Deltaproteobacteria bacterium]|jgi:predicted transposase YbfD/YdcC|nr:ISAs1 family transposase [Deltaproteobacteria bacterium]
MNNWIDQLQDFCGSLTDMRISRHKIHPLQSTVFLFLVAMLSGLTGWLYIIDWASQPVVLKWLRNFYPYEHGIPSVSTLARVISSLDIDELDNAFNKLNFHLLQEQFTDELTNYNTLQAIAIDGKTNRGAIIGGKKSKIHIVNAIMSYFVVGQIKVEEKSNEITAIPVMLKKLASSNLLANATVTIDAMGCQKEIAKNIANENAYYLINLKDNQKTMANEVELFFDELARNNNSLGVKMRTDEYGPEKNHGRISRWKVTQAEIDFEWVPSASKWEGIKTLIKVERETYSGNKFEKRSFETHCYISNHQINQELGYIIRKHWNVETLHYYLDVTFKEDVCRIRRGNSSEIFSLFRKIAFNILYKAHKKANMSMIRVITKFNRDPMAFGPTLGLVPNQPECQLLSEAA